MVNPWVAIQPTVNIGVPIIPNVVTLYFYFLLLTSYFLLPTSYFLLLTSYFLLLTSYFLLLTYFLLPLYPKFRNIDTATLVLPVIFL
ncbi:hypothetical protein J2T13_001404 [Paenibacillus sp. DS2015]|uniref:hypothetical protein n=1 Tax=Paenibacillus sp. DS2015 TaxID=3373917 RepID=UPI003D233065